MMAIWLFAIPLNGLIANLSLRALGSAINSAWGAAVGASVVAALAAGSFFIQQIGACLDDTGSVSPGVSRALCGEDSPDPAPLFLYALTPALFIVAGTALVERKQVGLGFLAYFGLALSVALPSIYIHSLG